MAKKPTKTLKLKNVKEDIKNVVKKRGRPAKVKTLDEQFEKATKAELIEMYKGACDINTQQSNTIAELKAKVEDTNKENLDLINENTTLSTDNEVKSATIKDQDEIIVALKKDVQRGANQVNDLKANNKALKTEAREEKARADTHYRKRIDAEVDLKDFKEMSIFKFIAFKIKN